MTLGLEIYKSKNVSISEKEITYKSFFKAPQTVLFENTIEMTAVLTLNGDREDFYLALYDFKWHYIKLDSIKRQDKYDILNFMHEKIARIVIPKFKESFEKGKEMNLGLLNISKNIGITRTNNIIREIKWNEIDLFEYKLTNIGVGFASIKFNNEIFEFNFKIGSLRQHTFLLETMRLMLGETKITDKTIYAEI